MNLELITSAFVVLVFIAAELYRCVRGSRGVITGFSECLMPGTGLGPISVSVEMEDGSMVNARMESCTACIGRLCVGDTVRISDSPGGLVADLPWTVIKPHAMKRQAGPDSRLCRNGNCSA